MHARRGRYEFEGMAGFESSMFSIVQHAKETVWGLLTTAAFAGLQRLHDRNRVGKTLLCSCVPLRHRELRTVSIKHDQFRASAERSRNRSDATESI